MLHGQTRFNIKSRFFDELPEEALKWLSPKVQHHWYANQQQKASWVDVPSRPSERPQNDAGWRIGQSVHHQKFGEGVIVNIEGGGGSARASINFGRHGMKLLDLTIAKLEKV
jgi:DNA helicase-2/ATP-dependent DNA helicase PcrA